MNFCEELFKVASNLDDRAYSELPDPSRTPLIGPPSAVGNRILPSYLLIGSEAQFHRFRLSIRRTMIRQFFDYRDDAAWSRQDACFDDLMGHFFRNDRGTPALLWTSPVWVTTRNWTNRSGFEQRNETLQISRYEVLRQGSTRILIRFGNGDTLPIGVSGSSFYYPDKPLYFLHTPRIRSVLGPDGRFVSGAYEEGIGLGHPDEERQLRKGIYTPNNDFALSERSIHFLDTPTITLARLVPLPSLQPTEEIDFGLRRRFAASNRRTSPFLPQAKTHPPKARVQFLRITFDPIEMRIVVLLSAERLFARFLVEHAGLADLLAQAFVTQV